MTDNEILYRLIKEALFQQEKSKKSIPIELEIGNKDNIQIAWNRVYSEAKAQAVMGIVAPAVVRHREIPESLRREWSGLQKTLAIKYVQMAEGQKETCKLLQKAGIPVAVMKGMAAAIYYPIPEYRFMGDVDLLVSPKNYNAAIDLLRKNGYTVSKDQGSPYHTTLIKYKILYELHRSPAGVHRTEKGDVLVEYILSGLEHIEMNELGQDRFPILPWKQNGMELIWHIRQHLYNGLGLRQIVDWMMFVNYMLNDERMKDYLPDLKKCGLDYLAMVVTKMCQKYLGLPRKNITWCDSADEKLCDELMAYIMEQGNFGMKATDEKTIKVFSGYNSPGSIFKRLKMVGETKWGLLKKYPGLKRFALVYGCIYTASSVFKRGGGVKKIIRDFKLGNQRKRMLSKLYGRKKGKKYVRETGDFNISISKF